MQQSLFRETADSEPLWTLRLREDSPRGVYLLADLLAAAFLFGLACALGAVFNDHAAYVGVFWPANGLLVAFLLTRRTERWTGLVAAAWFGNLLCNLSFGNTESVSAWLAFCNSAEIAIAAWFLRRAVWRSRNSTSSRSQELASPRSQDLASPRVMGEFALFAVLLAPAVSALLAGIGLHLLQGLSFAFILRSWFPSDALGIVIMVPLMIGFQHGSVILRLRAANLVSVFALFFGVLAATMLVFSQMHYQFLFLLFPLLLLVVFELGIFPALLSVFIVAVAGGMLTLQRHGPFWLGAGGTTNQSVLLLQVYVLATMACVLPIGATLQRQRILRKRLREGLERYQLLANNSRDIVVLSTLDGCREYVSPGVQDLLGWTQEEWTNQHSSDLMHPDDVLGYRRMLEEMLHGEDRQVLCYRTRHKDGRYLWMEASVRLMCDEQTGKPTGFVANVRDISQRVNAEQKLEAAYQQMQEQAQRDSLTGLYNRRRFDEMLELEWRRTRRNQAPLAVLMIDIDHFKRINDNFGHRAGDHCLQVLALCLQQVGRRPGDLVARYGGEEFVVLLPDVDVTAAMAIAERLRTKVRAQTVNAGVGCPISLTVSVGVAAQVPERHIRADSLVEAADHALYTAKQAGRDRVSAQQEVENAGWEVPAFDSL